MTEVSREFSQFLRANSAQYLALAMGVSSQIPSNSSQPTIRRY
jgi:hypothetical protein